MQIIPKPNYKIVKKPDGEYTQFRISVEMRSEWVAHFLAMLKYMQYLGGVGSSREVSIYSDGDGSFRPKFEWDKRLPSDAEPVRDEDGHRKYDTG